METTKNSIWKSALFGGAIIGFSLIIYSLILYVLNINTSTAAGYLSYIILGIGLYITGKDYRDKMLGGYINYSQALGFGVIVSLLAAVILAIFTFIQLKFIDPGLIEKQLQIVEDKLIQKGISENQMEVGLSMARKMMSAEIAPFIIIINYVCVGFIISLITSAIIKKEGNPFSTKSEDILDDKSIEESNK